MEVVVAAKGLGTIGRLMLLGGCFHRKASVVTESSVNASRRRPRERWRWHGAADRADDDDVLMFMCVCGERRRRGSDSGRA